MSDVVTVAIISAMGSGCCSLLGILAANKLSNYRIEQLEKKVEKHNNLVERMYHVEDKIKEIDLTNDMIKKVIDAICVERGEN